LNLETGETEEKKLVHDPGETEKYYRQFPVAGGYYKSGSEHQS
jgi:hypothetical protein